MSTFHGHQDANASVPQPDELECLHDAPQHLANDGEYYCIACGERLPDPPAERYTACDGDWDKSDDAEYESELHALSEAVNTDSPSSILPLVDDSADNIPF